MDRKLNVLTVIRHPVGGIRTYLKYTYAHLNKNKYQFTILIAHDDYESHIIREDLKGFDLKICEVNGKYANLKMVFYLVQVLRKKDIDVIHSQGFTAGMLANLVNFLIGKPHVITTHGIVSEGLFSTRFGFLKRWVFEFLLARAAIIQTVSHDAQENLIKHLPSLSRRREKLAVITNGISVEQFCNGAKGSGPSLREELEINKDVYLFGYLGRFMPEKGFPYLINAVEKLSKNSEFKGKFKILAVNDGSYIREYKAIIQKKNISDYFIFYGFTPDVAWVLQGLDAVVIPSLYEGCPLIPMEAFVLGCPVIASNCIGLREVVANSPAVYIEKIADSDAIAEALNKFMSDTVRIKKDTLDFMLKARERFDARKTAESLDILFENLLRKREIPCRFMNR